VIWSGGEGRRVPPTLIFFLRSGAGGLVLPPASAPRSQKHSEDVRRRVAVQIARLSKNATLVFTIGDLLEITSNIECAWMEGRKIYLNNKQVELERRYRRGADLHLKS